MTLNVLILRTHYPHWGSFSGINQVLNYIDPKRFNVDVRVVSDSDDDFPVQNKWIRGCLRHMVQRRGMQWYKLSDLVAEIKTFKKCLSEKVDVVHFLDGEHSAQFLPTLLRLKHLRNHRPKLVATYHQPPEILDSLTIKKVMSRLDYVTVVSPEQLPYFRKFLNPDRMRSILHGIDIEFFKPGNKRKNDGKFKCITVGHYLRDYRMVRQVAEWLRNHRYIEFHVVSSQTAELEGLENVKTYRGIDDAKLLDLYQQSDLLFLPLLQSTANNVLLEGIACGLPVLSTFLPSVKAYLPGDEAILMKNNEAGHFIEAILHLFNNPKEREKMGLEARKRAEQLDWCNIAKQYETVYSELANDQ
jgi:glycosyltransferase involved in cell wall biosynthesis